MSQLVTLNASDGQGGHGGITFGLVVNNVPPTANPGGPYTTNEGSPTNFIGISHRSGSDDFRFGI